MDIDKIAEKFMQWLIDENWFSVDDVDIDETFKQIKEDFKNIENIAPRLLNLIYEISDRY